MPKPKPHHTGAFVPHQPTAVQRALAWIIYALTRVVVATLRFRWKSDSAILSAEGRPYIFCTWHNRLALAPFMYRHFCRTHQVRSKMAALVSASRDGAMMARVLELFQMQPARGSSTRRGPQALLELARLARRGHDIAFIPDGPRGPRYQCKDGIISLAQVTGRPIVPASFHVSRKIVLRNWDRFQIPLPFSRVTFAFGEPLVVPRDASEVMRENIRQELDRRLMALTKD